MKEMVRIVFCLCVYGWMDAAGLGAEDLTPGMSEEAVLTVLGQPAGSIEISGWKVLLFEEGKALVENGTVKVLDLYSEAELERKAQQRERLEKKQAALMEAKAKRKQEGEQLKLEKLGDAEFIGQSLEAQIRYWEFFAQRYQGVEVAELIRGLRNELAEKRAGEAMAEEVARVEYPVRRARNAYWPVDYFSWEGSHSYGVGRIFPYKGRPVIREFEDVSLFSPKLEGLPGGSLRKHNNGKP